MKRQPVRTCVACREEGVKRELIRLVRSADGLVAVDRTGRAPGRGAYLHASEACLEQARRRKALDRALGAVVGPAVWAELASGL